LRLALVEASERKIGSPVDELLLFCYHYDPATGKYGSVVVNFLRLASAATVLAIALFLTILLRQESRHRTS
jgi:protein SCO1/2